MSQAVFPSLPGLTWDRERSPEFSTLLQTSVSGLQAASALWNYPVYTYGNLGYDILRSGAPFAELQTLMGFFNQRKGRLDTFLYDDPEDDSVTGQPIATGDGVATSFQLVRTFGGWTDPVRDVNAVSNVYLNGVGQISGWTVNSLGVLTFSSPPGDGVAITATFSYYWRCRFTLDKLPFNLAMFKWWELKKLEFQTVKYSDAPVYTAAVPLPTGILVPDTASIQVYMLGCAGGLASLTGVAAAAPPPLIVQDTGSSQLYQLCAKNWALEALPVSSGAPQTVHLTDGTDGHTYQVIVTAGIAGLVQL